MVWGWATSLCGVGLGHLAVWCGMGTPHCVVWGWDTSLCGVGLGHLAVWCGMGTPGVI